MKTSTDAVNGVDLTILITFAKEKIWVSSVYQNTGRKVDELNCS